MKKVLCGSLLFSSMIICTGSTASAVFGNKNITKFASSSLNLARHILSSGTSSSTSSSSGQGISLKKALGDVEGSKKFSSSSKLVYIIDRNLNSHASGGVSILNGKVTTPTSDSGKAGSQVATKMFLKRFQ